MTRGRGVAVGLVLAIGAAWSSPPAQAQDPPDRDTSDIGEALGIFMQGHAEREDFSGAVLLAHEGRVLYQAAFGLANRDFAVPNQADTKFNLGSMNKMFTAVAVAQLAERGVLSFDDPLSDFLPDFPDVESAGKIRIEHLLTHTAGLGSYFNDTFFESSRARFRTVDEMLELAAEEVLQFEPGTQWRYSNTGMLVLGAVIESATGQDYFSYIRENIYSPAGMTNSGSFELDKVNENLALGYEPVTEGGTRHFVNNLCRHVIRGGPAGGGYSTTEDLLAFAQALRSGKLVGEPFVEVLLTPKPDLNSPSYGYGFGVDDRAGVVGHSGGFPGISSNLDMFLESGHTAIVLSNLTGGATAIVRKIRELVAQAN